MHMFTSGSELTSGSALVSKMNSRQSPRRGSFADALRQQNEKRKTTHRREQQTKIAVQLDTVNMVMKRLVNDLEAGSPDVSQTIRRTIHCHNSEDVRQAMSRWRDGHGLNLVHYLILNDHSEMLRFVLEETCVFPKSLQPSICPYAHLAAYIGATKCVEIILIARPTDFFQCQTPEHDLQLPQHIEGRLGLIHRDVKAYDQLIKKVKSFNINAIGPSIVDKVSPKTINDLIHALQNIEERDDKDGIYLPPLKGEAKVSIAATKPTRAYTRIKRPQTYTQLFTKIESHISFKEKTPLVIAAEMGHVETILVILKLYLKRDKRAMSIPSSHGPLVMATRAMSPEALLALLESSQYTTEDYQDAVLGAIRCVLPDCLAALLSYSPKKNIDLLGGMNLYHTLYTQCMDVKDARYQGITMMTRVLMNNNRNINDCTVPNSFPLYTLITLSFNTKSFKRMYYIFQCMNILLEAGADIFFNEINTKTRKSTIRTDSLEIGRSPFTSVFHCIFENAIISIDTLGVRTVHEMVTSLIVFVLQKSKKRRSSSCAVDRAFQPLDKVNMKKVLYLYMDAAVYLGLNDNVIKMLLKYGADPEATDDDKFPVNAYFDNLSQYFEDTSKPLLSVNNEYDKKEMNSLLIICQTMDKESLNQMNKILLCQYVERKIPVEAVTFTKYFLYLVDTLRKQNGWYMPALVFPSKPR